METLEEQYKKDLNIYLLNEDAAYSILALTRYASTEKCCYKWKRVDELIQNVIKYLSNKDVVFKYKGDMEDLDKKTIHLKLDLYDNYGDLIKNSKIPDVIRLHLDDRDEYNLADIFYELIEKYCPKDRIREYMLEVLCSKMDINDRANFCIDLIKHNYRKLTEILMIEQIPTIIPSTYKMKRKEKLIQYMQDNPEINEKLVETVGTMRLLKRNFFQSIDFSSPATVKKAIEIFEKEMVGVLPIYELMQSPKYKNNTTLEQKSDDLLNILANIDIRYINHYTYLFNLEYDPEVLLIIASILRDNWNSIDDNENKRDDIINNFLSRSVTTRDEYRKRLVYAKRFLKIVNDEKARKINEANKREELQCKLSNVLTRTLDKAQNQKIKNIINKETPSSSKIR